MSLPSQVNITLIDFQLKSLQYPPNLLIKDVCCDILSKNYDKSKKNNPDVTQYGLYLSSKGIWLDPERTLEQYQISNSDTLSFCKKHRLLRIKTMDGKIHPAISLEFQPVSTILKEYRGKIGFQYNEDEYALFVNHPKISGGCLKKNKSLHEQGISEMQVLLLKRRLFLDDPQTLDPNNETMLNCNYSQYLEMILKGELPVTLEEALKLGGLQMQVEFGNHEPKKHRVGLISLKNFAPNEYAKNKELEKKILAEHQKNQGLNTIKAKVSYVQICESLKTFGGTYFVVKEPPSESIKISQIVQLGITKTSIIRINRIDKSKISEWSLRHLRSWQILKHGILLEFASNHSQKYIAETSQAKEFSELLSDYASTMSTLQKITMPDSQFKFDMKIYEDNSCQLI